MFIDFMKKIDASKVSIIITSTVKQIRWKPIRIKGIQHWNQKHV